MAALKTNVWVAGAFALLAFPAFAADPVVEKADPHRKDLVATFVAEAKGNTVAIYSNFKETHHCEVFVKFSVLQEGKRVTGDLRCFEKDFLAGKHLLACNITSPVVIEPKIEGPIDGECR